MSDRSGVPQKPFVFPTAKHHPNQPEELPLPAVEDPSEEAIDAGIEESFPASDPVSVTVSKVHLPDDGEMEDKTAPATKK